MAFQSYAHRLEALRAIDQAILSASPLDDLLALAICRLATLLPCEHIHISVFDLAGGFATTLAMLDPTAELSPGRRYPLPPPEMLKIFQQGWPIHIADLQLAAEADPRLAVLQGHGQWAILGVPMVADGQIVGAIKIGRAAPGRFAEDAILIAQDLAAALAVGIAQDRLRAAEQQSRRIAQAISAANLALTHHLDLAAVLDTLLDNLLLLVPYDSAVVFLLEDETILRPYAMRGYDPRFAPAGAGDHGPAPAR